MSKTPRYKDPRPIQMHVCGKRIYCSGLTGDQQKLFIDALGMEMGILLDQKPVRVKVKSVRSAKCMLEIVG